MEDGTVVTSENAIAACRLARLRPGRDGVGHRVPRVGGLRPGAADAQGLSRPHRPGVCRRCLHARGGRGHRVAPHRGLGRRGARLVLRAHCRDPDERPRGARPLRRVRQLQRRRGAARDRGRRADHLRRDRQDRCGAGREPHPPGPTGVRDSVRCYSAERIFSI